MQHSVVRTEPTPAAASGPHASSLVPEARKYIRMHRSQSGLEKVFDVLLEGVVTQDRLDALLAAFKRHVGCEVGGLFDFTEEIKNTRVTFYTWGGAVLRKPFVYDEASALEALNPPKQPVPECDDANLNRKICVQDYELTPEELVEEMEKTMLFFGVKQ
jgi:hypothetical protein